MTRKELVVVAIVFVVLTVALTWPLAQKLDHGGRVDSGDGRFSVWNVAWVAHALTTNPWQLYNANIFDPLPNTLAFSEANLVAGLLAVPVWEATSNPYASMNAVILLSFVLSGSVTYALVRRLTGSAAGAALGAMAFAFCPFVYSHLPHIQLLMTFGIPLVLLRLHVFVDSPSPARAVWLGATMALAGLACGYYGIFASMAAGLGVAWFGLALGRWRNPRYWALGLVAAATAMVIIAPFYAPYGAIRAGGFQRTLEEARLHSAGWRSYLASPILLHSWMLPLIGTWRDVLFPGFLSIGFAAVAVVKTGRRRETKPLLPPAVMGFYLLLAGLALWASLGPDAGLYTLLHHTLPFFSLLRAPSRFGLLVSLALAVLAGAGFASVARLVRERRRRWVVAACVAAMAARSTTGPLMIVDAPPVPIAHQRLAGLPRGPVAEFPSFASAVDRHRQTEYMLLSTFHWQPLISGYSDYIPAQAFADMQALTTFPDPAAWDVLREHRTRYVVLHWNRFTKDETDRIILALPSLKRSLRPIVERPDASLYEVIRWPSLE